MKFSTNSTSKISTEILCGIPLRILQEFFQKLFQKPFKLLLCALPRWMTKFADFASHPICTARPRLLYHLFCLCLYFYRYFANPRFRCFDRIGSRRTPFTLPGRVCPDDGIFLATDQSTFDHANRAPHEYLWLLAKFPPQPVWARCTSPHSCQWWQGRTFKCRGPAGLWSWGGLSQEIIFDCVL